MRVLEQEAHAVVTPRYAAFCTMAGLDTVVKRRLKRADISGLPGEWYAGGGEAAICELYIRCFQAGVCTLTA